MPRTLTAPVWNRQFAKRLREHLGINYPIPTDDWHTAEYLRRCEHLSPKDAADKLADSRLKMEPDRRSCKAWFDHYRENGVYDREFKGQFRCEPCVPPAVTINILAAIEKGETEGEVKHWEPMHTQAIISFCRLADGPSKTLAPRFQIGDIVTWEAAGEQPMQGLVVTEVRVIRNSCPHIRITARCGHRMAEACQRFFRLDEIPATIGAFDLDAETDF